MVVCLLLSSVLLTLSVGHQEGHLACQKLRWYAGGGDLIGAKCK